MIWNMERKLEINSDICIGDNFPTYIIAEIGQNHQGDIEIAKNMILLAKKNGANCVKFQKSNLNEKFTQKALDRPYISKNSWGKTYREHKEYLEFSKEQYRQLQLFSINQNIIFTASAMDIKSVDFLCDELKVPMLKIGSGDANNIPLIRHAASKFVPLIISTGMQNLDNVKQIYETVMKYHSKLVLMHCTSSYPLLVDNVNLRVIQLYQDLFPNICIGYSGHEFGIDVCIAAVALGVRVIERHFTTDHFHVGSDHQCSLTPHQLCNLVSRIRNIEVALGIPKKIFQLCELPCYRKLGKSIVMAESRDMGHILTENDLIVKVSEPQGIDGFKLDSLIGRKLNKNLKKDDVIMLQDLV